MEHTSWLVRNVKERIRHIHVYLESNSMESLRGEFVAMKREEDNQEKTGWLMRVEFVMATTHELVKKEEFLVYPRKSKAIDPLSTIVGAVVLELIAANTDASYRINLRQTERLVEVAITKELLDEPVYYETDDWRCIKLLR